MNSDTKTTPQLLENAVMPRYFKCRFFRGHLLHSVILEAKDEIDIKIVFSKRCRSRHLLEVIEV